MESIIDIQNKVRKCTRCPLHETRTNAVSGTGSFTADVMFVGEAPGRSEDIAGKPFVGAAGKRLEAALKSAGVSRESVYITNIVKCRPPDNRVPTNTEQESCAEYLENEIQIINPKIICVLGNTAFASLLGGSDITNNHGKTVKRDNRIYFVSFHPAATIYNQKLIEKFEKDILQMFSLVAELKNGKDIPIDIDHTS